MSHKILSLNIANANRDNVNGWSLYGRWHKVIDLVNKHCPVIACFSEAGRPSPNTNGDKIGWAEHFIPEIEKNTNLKFVKLFRNSDDIFAFGICIFAQDPDQILNCERHVICDGNLGNICVNVQLNLYDKPFTFTVTHLHVVSDARFEGLKNVLKHNADLIFGDFNAFPDDNADAMCEEIGKANYKILTRRRPTFISFPHDPIKKHPKIKHFRDVNDTDCLVFSPLDYALSKDEKNVKVDILHPISGDIIKEDDDVGLILDEVLMNDKLNPYDSRCSDHLALLISL